eukprot:Phypoly_transcript_08680.p1 GENE.Phypoly_transcript_08680~~Phypoly_transcript_08680.p1  ORF type:complete len:340 (+),score=53.50 Phypoly_transcript_08680:123-1142(+)
MDYKPAPKRDLHTVSDFTKAESDLIIQKAQDIKSNPLKYGKLLEGKTVLMLFEKPSLRTRVSLETGIHQMGGHAIFYSIVDSPISKMKDNIHDTAKTASRYVNIIAARLYHKKDFEELARHATVPVINLLDDYGHPCQILADFQTIAEKKDLSTKKKISFFGDGQNNVTYELIRMCAIYGFDMDVACPAQEGYAPIQSVLDEANKIGATTGSKFNVTQNITEAAKNSDIIYSDTWMSYHVKSNEESARKEVLAPYQVTAEVMKAAKPDAVFMHCLPATRGNEMTAEVIDGPQSVVFDQAENRLHVQKAIVLFLLGYYGRFNCQETPNLSLTQANCWLNP